MHEARIYGRRYLRPPAAAQTGPAELDGARAQRDGASTLIDGEHDKALKREHTGYSGDHPARGSTHLPNVGNGSLPEREVSSPEDPKMFNSQMQEAGLGYHLL